MVTNGAPTIAKPLHIKLQEEVWLDVHLKKIIAKRIIGHILLYEQLKYITPLLFVVRIWSG